MMKILFRRYLSGEIDEGHLLEHLKFDTLDQLHRLLLEMYEVNEEGLRKVLLFWFNKLERIQEDKGWDYKDYVKEIKRMHDTGSLFEYEPEELLEILLNFAVIQRLTDKILEVYGKNNDFLYDRESFRCEVEQGCVVMLVLKDVGLRSIKEIEGIQFLKRLRVLNLACNLIEKIEGLESLVNLEFLIFGDGHYKCGNQISKIEGLETLSKLTDLDLSFNNIKKIEGLEHLESLEYLNLMHNQITEIEGLDSLKRLEEVELLDNPVEDTMDIQALFKQFKNLKVVNYEERK